MTGKEKQRYEARAQIVKGLAHPSRLLLVDELLRWGERCVYDLTAAVGSDMSTVSRHLLMLKKCRNRHGREAGKNGVLPAVYEADQGHSQVHRMLPAS